MKLFGGSVAAFVCLAFGPSMASAQAHWPAGHTYWAASQTPYGVIDVTNGGDVSSASLFTALPGRIPGQLAWSADATTMYATQFDNNVVVAVTPAGVATTFASNVSGPTGILRTFDNHLLVASYNASAIFDITAGGNFSGATAVSTGVAGVRNLIQLADGRVLAAGQSSGTVYDIHYPTYGTPTAFATGLGVVGDLAQTANGHIYVSEYGNQKVVDITAGGDFSSAAGFATGQQFMALAVDYRGHLLANQLGGGSVWDITAGGSFASAAAFATNAHGGETGLDVVSTARTAVEVVNEPAGANCIAGGVAVITCADINDSGVCDAGEAVLSTQYVCNGVDTLVTSTALAAGDANCPDGGSRIDIGLDNGDGGGTAGDGILQAGEIDSTTYVCNGHDGSNGSAGTNGSDGSNGMNGSNGTNGANGENSLVKTSPIASGDATCPAGGVRIEVGTDNGDGGGTAGDGVLQDGEIDSSTVVCNGDKGASGGCNAGGEGGSLGAIFAIALLFVPRRRRR